MSIKELTPASLATFFNFCSRRTDAIAQHDAYINDASFDGAIVVFVNTDLPYVSAPLLLKYERTLSVTGYGYMSDKFCTFQNLAGLQNGVDSGNSVRPATVAEIDVLTKRLFEEENFKFVIS